MNIFENPFVVNTTHRIYLSDDQKHWIEIKTQLNSEEQGYVNTAGFTSMSGETDPNTPDTISRARIDVDWQAFQRARLEKYLVRWSFEKLISRQTIKDLTPEVCDAIDNAILAFIREQKKSEPSTPTNTKRGSARSRASAGS